MTNKWILAPAIRCVEFVAEEAKIGGLLQRALVHIEMGEPLFRLTQQIFQQHGNSDAVAAIELLLQQAPYHEEWARQLRESEYAPINAHAVTAIWGALETCIEDTIVAILANDPTAQTTIELIGVKRKSDQLSGADDQQRRNLYNTLENKLRVVGDVVKTYENVLGVFGLSAATTNGHTTLLELNAVRNCIVHRGGIVDAKAVREAPCLSAYFGTEIKISRADFERYHQAVSDWVVALSASISASRFASQ